MKKRFMLLILYYTLLVIFINWAFKYDINDWEFYVQIIMLSAFLLHFNDVYGNLFKEECKIKKKWKRRLKEMDEYLKLYGHRHTNGERLTLESQYQIINEFLEDLENKKGE